MISERNHLDLNPEAGAGVLSAGNRKKWKTALRKHHRIWPETDIKHFS